MTKSTWLGTVLLFFAWGFVMHSVGLLIHEFAGHALAATLLACGIDGYNLTYFGHGQVSYPRWCNQWTDADVVITSWAGLFITILTGLGAAVFLHRKRATPLHPMTRLLVAQVVFFFLLGQLSYATAGGFHDLYDPGRTARWLGKRGLHLLAWVPPLVAYTAVAFLCVRTTVDAFRAQFASRSRLHGLLQLVLTFGPSGFLFWLAFRIEWGLRTDMEMKGVAVEAKRIAVAQHTEPPFPIELVLLGIAVVGLVAALVRPTAKEPVSPAPTPRRVVVVVAGATAACVLLLTVMIRAR